jgi:hypothetical protein
MSSHVIKVLVPPSVVSPRGARWAAAAAVWIGRILSAPGGPKRGTAVRSAEVAV